MNPRLFGGKYKQPGWGWEWFIEYEGRIYPTGIKYSAGKLRMPYVMFLAASIPRHHPRIGGRQFTEADIERRAA